MKTDPDPTGVRRLVAGGAGLAAPLCEWTAECACDYSNEGPCARCAEYNGALRDWDAALAAVRVAELERVVEAATKVDEYAHGVVLAYGYSDAKAFVAACDQLRQALAALDESKGAT